MSYISRRLLRRNDSSEHVFRSVINWFCVAETPDDWLSIHAWVEIIKLRL